MHLVPVLSFSPFIFIFLIFFFMCLIDPHETSLYHCKMPRIFAGSPVLQERAIYYCQKPCIIAKEACITAKRLACNI